MRKRVKTPTPWTTVEIVFAVAMTGFFVVAIVHSFLKFFEVI